MSKRPKALRALVYVRVSKKDQRPANQFRQLREYAERHGWQIVRVYKDRKTGATTDRKAFKQMMQDVAKHRGDVVMTWAVDRMGRSLVDLIHTMDTIHHHGVDLYIHQQNIDTTSPGGRMVFQILGAFSEFERAMIRERVNAGLDNARAQGKKLGRPSKRNEKETARVKALRAEGKTIKYIADELNRSVGWVHGVAKEDDETQTA